MRKEPAVFIVSSFTFQVSGLTSSIIPRTPSSDYAFPQGLLLHVITGRFGLIQVSGFKFDFVDTRKTPRFV